MLNERKDRNGGIYYNQYDPLRLQKNWREIVMTEAKARAENGPPNFQMNLVNQNGSGGLLKLTHSHNRLEIVTEKEHKQSPAARRSIKGMCPNSFEVLAIKHLEKKPSHKWDLPEVSSHDIGWTSGDFVRAATMCPAKSTTGSLVSATGKNPSSTSGSVAGSLAGASSSSSVPSKQSITVVANDHILRRVQSAPHLPTGPRPKELSTLNGVKWRRPMRQSDVTTFAEHYQSLLHHNPFNLAAAGR